MTRGSTAARATGLALLAVLLGLPGLAAPFPDGLHGNCGAFFSIMARNANALGLAVTHAVPVINPVPPATPAAAEWYTHHPPGLPLLVTLASRLPWSVEVGARLVALLLHAAATVLLADLARRTVGRRAAAVAAALMLGLPAAWLHRTLVNYETIAVPATLLLTRSLVLGRPSPALTAPLAAFSDWIALLPLAFAPWRARAMRAVTAVLAGGAAVAAIAWLHRSRFTTSWHETLTHALGATALAPDFSLGAWATAGGDALLALLGPALLTAPLALLGWRAAPADARRVLAILTTTAVVNVVVFARHATGHEVFWLPFVPCAAFATALALRERPSDGLRTAGVVALVVAITGVSAFVASGRVAARTTTQAEAGDAIAAHTPRDAIYVLPDGAPLVLLHRARRHLAPYGAASLGQARDAVAALRERHALEALPGFLLVPAEGEPPGWAAPLGPGVVDGGWRRLPLGD